MSRNGDDASSVERIKTQLITFSYLLKVVKGSFCNHQLIVFKAWNVDNFLAKWIEIQYISTDKKSMKYKRWGLNITTHVTIAIFFSAWLINMLISFNSKSVISTHIFVVIVQCPANENIFFEFPFEFMLDPFKNYESGTQ